MAGGLDTTAGSGHSDVALSASTSGFGGQSAAGIPFQGGNSVGNQLPTLWPDPLSQR